MLGERKEDSLNSYTLIFTFSKRELWVEDWYEKCEIEEKKPLELIILRLNTKFLKRKLMVSFLFHRRLFAERNDFSFFFNFYLTQRK